MPDEKLTYLEILELYNALGIEETLEDDDPITSKDKYENIPKETKIEFDYQMKNNNTNKNKDLKIKSEAKDSFSNELLEQKVKSINSLEELKQIVTAFDGLSITQTATNTVFSDGNPKAEIMLLGEAPGAEEDLKAIPFCGRSGRLLNSILLQTGLSREKNIYISNTVFWRPPGNRRPTPEELHICSYFVKKHISIVNPKLIILLGGTAVKSLFSEINAEIANTPITQLRGKFLKYKNEYLQHYIETIAVFHPSYLLRSPIQKKFFWEDMIKINKYISEKNIFI